jgi:hypothetical protein
MGIAWRESNGRVVAWFDTPAGSVGEGDPLRLRSGQALTRLNCAGFRDDAVGAIGAGGLQKITQMRSRWGVASWPYET